MSLSCVQASAACACFRALFSLSSSEFGVSCGEVQQLTISQTANAVSLALAHITGVTDGACGLSYLNTGSPTESWLPTRNNQNAE
jgi:hypothetical protein